MGWKCSNPLKSAMVHHVALQGLLRASVDLYGNAPTSWVVLVGSAWRWLMVGGQWCAMIDGDVQLLAVSVDLGG